MTTTNYAADRTALLIVGPYNDFMSKGGRPCRGLLRETDGPADAEPPRPLCSEPSSFEVCRLQRGSIGYSFADKNQGCGGSLICSRVSTENSLKSR